MADLKPQGTGNLKGVDVVVKRVVLAIAITLILLTVGMAAEQPQADEGAAKASQGEIELIPLEVLLGNPDKISPQTSDDGKYLTYVAPQEGVLNIWIRTIGKDDDRPLTFDEGRGISRYFWAYNNEQVIYVQDEGGDENYRIYSVDISSGDVTLLTPDEPGVEHPVRAQIIAGDPERADELLIGLNNRDQRLHDIYLLNIRTGSRSLVVESKLGILGWLIDHDMEVRGYSMMENDGGKRVMLRNNESGEYEQIYQWGRDDALTSGVAGFTPDNHGLYFIDSTGRNTAALMEFDPDDGSLDLLASDPIYDVTGTFRHPSEHYVQAVLFNRDIPEWEILDKTVQADFDFLQSAHRGYIAFTNITTDNKSWLLAYIVDDGPVSYYAYDRENGELGFLFYHREELAKLPLTQMKPISFKSRDDLTIHGYLGLPINWQGPGPMVLNVHGGPWARDSFTFHPEVQWLTNRGYACLQVNFRGSSGYGKDFINAGDREWGCKMQNDLTDAVKWAVASGIADENKVVIYGGSYGGYATLCGVTFTPDLYAAGISLVGPSNLETFLNTIPPYWESARQIFDDRVGRIPRYTEGEKAGMVKDEADFSEEDRDEIEFLHSRSPLFYVDNVRVPMLIAQGANDPRVKQAESDQFVQAMRAQGLEVEYVVYDNEGHGFVQPDNRLDFYHRADKFLARILDGRYEEWVPKE